jgi:hypothetical protein
MSEDLSRAPRTSRNAAERSRRGHKTGQLRAAGRVIDPLRKPPSLPPRRTELLPGWASPPTLDESSRERQSIHSINNEGNR